MSENTGWAGLRCSFCQQQISSPVPKTTQLRAWIECYACNESDKTCKALRDLVVAVYGAATNSDWCDESLADALIEAEKCLPKHRLL